MEQQEIQDRNVEITLMLGWEQYKDSKERWFEHWKPNTMLEKPWSNRVERLEFDSDWNWLMEAVDFIEKLQSDNFYMEFFWLQGPNVSLYQRDKQTGSTLWETHGRFKNVETKKEAIFLAVSDFAKLHNNKK